MGRRDRRKFARYQLRRNVLQASGLSPQLLAKNFPYDDDRHIELTQAEFLARAWRLANDKARELR